MSTRSKAEAIYAAIKGALTFVPFWTIPLWLILAYASPFGISEVTDRHIANLANQILGPRYGQSSFPTPEGRDLITVVTVTDDDLRLAETSWPPSYGFHATRLSQIARREPTAIFVDVFFHKPHENDDSLNILVDVLEDIENGAYMSPPHEGEGDPRPRPIVLLAGDPDACHGGVIPELAGPMNTRVVPAPRSTDLEDRHERTYPLTTSFDERPDCRRYSISARFYYEYLFRDLQRDRSRHPTTSEFEWRALLDDMTVIWANQSSPENLQTVHCAESGTLLSRFQDRLIGAASDFKSLCPYHRTLQSHSLFLEKFREDTVVYLKDKFVFYGMDRLYSYDRMISPTHAEIPTIYLHAMVFDNLITFGTSYLRDMSGQTLASLVLITTMLFLVALARGFFRFWLDNAFAGDGPAKTETLWLACSVDLCLLIEVAIFWLAVAVFLCFGLPLASRALPYSWFVDAIALAGLFLFALAGVALAIRIRRYRESFRIIETVVVPVFFGAFVLSLLLITVDVAFRSFDVVPINAIGIFGMVVVTTIRMSNGSGSSKNTGIELQEDQK